MKAPKKKELNIICRFMFCVCVFVCIVDEWRSVCPNIERSGCQGQGQTDVVLKSVINH